MRLKSMKNSNISFGTIREIAISPAIVVFYLIACIFPAVGASYDVTEKNIEELQQDLSKGRVTSVELVNAYLSRIKLIDQDGPKLRSIIAINPDVLNIAEILDEERKVGKVRSPLHGIPIVLKDNIETADPMPTTNGSIALKNNISNKDSGVAERLRSAGVIILGKSNLSNWSEIQSSYAIGGWSALGGLVKKPICS